MEVTCRTYFGNEMNTDTFVQKRRGDTPTDYGALHFLCSYHSRLFDCRMQCERLIESDFYGSSHDCLNVVHGPGDVDSTVLRICKGTASFLQSARDHTTVSSMA
ncbi:unnamed protein product [Phytophthora fragariaefolia]|uniref:Unnamed protein product n=1 Tax=Phytophthora fragariaefolia TaxID=1490495 RepID=A0A9W6XSI6_9STRA|nr:unnamed protein product [Phytophthora fragariaefolia]